MLTQPFSVVQSHQYNIKGCDVWQTFKNGRSIQLKGRVNSISVCPSVPYRYCLPNGHKIYLYKCDEDRLYRKLSGFGTRVTCCQFRNDGKLVIVGEENGVVRMCTTDKNGFHLRKLDAHKGSVTAAAFFVDGHTAASIGTDSIVRLWDVSLGTDKQKFRLGSGSEPAKALVVGRQECNFMCCGDLEGCVSIYDIRERKPVHTFKVPNAVSALAVNQDDSQLVVADGPSIRVWDPRQQMFLLESASPNDPTDQSPNSLRLHYKTVTALWVTNHPDPTGGEVLLSVSTDKLFKVTHLRDWKELHQIRCPQPLTAVAATPNGNTILIGGDKGFVKVQHMRPHYESTHLRVKSAGVTAPPEDSEDIAGLDPSLFKLAGEFSGRWRGGDRFVAMTTEDWLSQPFDGPRLGPGEWLEDKKKDGTKRIVPLIHETSEISRDDLPDGRAMAAGQIPATRVERLLLRFSHSDALSTVTRSRIRMRTAKPGGYAFMHPVTARRLAIGVVRELVRRDTLAAAVAGRTTEQLIRLLRFIRRNVWRKEAAATCLTLYNCVLDVYTAEELNSISEFPKVNDVLRTLSHNTQALAAITHFLEHPDIATVMQNSRKSKPTGTRRVKQATSESKPSLQFRKPLGKRSVSGRKRLFETNEVTNESPVVKPKPKRPKLP